MSLKSLVIILNLLSRKVERPLTSSHADGVLACQTDQKFLNWVLKTQTEFWSDLCLAKGYISQAVGKYFMWRKIFILSESVRILQKYLNMVGFMEKNDRTYRCSNTNYIRNVPGPSLDWVSGYLDWVFSWFSSVSENNSIMVLPYMTHVVLPSPSLISSAFYTNEQYLIYYK